MAASGSVSDPVFYGVAHSDALKLKRDVEMYQWEERKSSHTAKTNGGGSRTETNYSYGKRWSALERPFAIFYESYAHVNSVSVGYALRIGIVRGGSDYRGIL